MSKNRCLSLYDHDRDAAAAAAAAIILVVPEDSDVLFASNKDDEKGKPAAMLPKPSMEEFRWMVYAVAIQKLTSQGEECDFKIEAADGSSIESEDDTVGEITTFFNGQFRGIEGLEWSPISETAAADLEKPFEEDEVKREVFGREGNKSPGPDVYILSLFQACWEGFKKRLRRAPQGAPRGEALQNCLKG
ncbi:hypothetical protein L484_024171 [Morus notabilis]|uniref:Uncharacterized protein n=1 Tax=Morus notabilis TaxID=981085 RepID=W9RXP8_9ROSA|nr:hypothetical protein L484_024171 [Morus notabilis]